VAQLPTVESFHASPHPSLDHKPAEWVVRALLARRQNVAPEDVVLPTEVDRHVVATAEVRDGRWLVRCPWCPSAQETSPSDRRFWCVGCANIAVGGKWVRVQWPKDWDAAEDELLKRPPENRHFLPGESVADLRRENVAHEVA
jgi:hypothetical protein